MIRYGCSMMIGLAIALTGISAQAGERLMHPKSAYNLAWIKSHSRSCKQADLPGIWRLITYDAPYRFKNAHAPYLQPHQLFQFTSDGGMKSAHSPVPLREDPTRVFAGIPQDITYTFDRDGLLKVQGYRTAETKETWRCVAIMRDRHDREHHFVMKRGDILMTLLGTNGHIVFMRQLRKDPA